MQVVHTAALPPNHGRITLAISGCTWKSRQALRKTQPAFRIIKFRHPGRREGSDFVQPTSRFFGLRPQNENAFWIGQLERAGIDTAVDQEILAGDVARLDAAKVGAELAELLGGAEAAGRDLFFPFAFDLLRSFALLLRRNLSVADQPVGPEAPREQVVDGDVVRDGFARETRDKAGEAAPRAVRQGQLGDRRLYRARGDVDDAPEAPRDHSIHRRLDQLDRSEHVRAQRLQPVFARELAKIRRRGSAGVGDEDVGLRAGGERRDAAQFAGDVRRHRDDDRAGGGADLVRGFFQSLALARHQRDAAAFARERGGAAPAQPLACAAYQRGRAANFQVHYRSPEKLSRRPQRHQHHAAQHQSATRQLYRGHGLVQSHPAEKNGGQRTERPDQGDLVRADAAQCLGGDEYRKHGRKNRHGDRYAVYGRRQREGRERPEQEELRDAKNARDRHGVGGETDRAHALHHLAAGHEIDGVARRARETQGCAQRQVGVAVPEQGRHHQRNPGVGEDQRDDLADARALVQKNYREHDDQRGIEEQDQAAQSRRNVLQAQKIDEAGEVIPDESQKHDRPDVAPGEPVAGRVAPDPGCGREKEWQGENHAQREQRDRIDDVAVGELDQDGAKREAHHARDRHRDADGAVGSRRSHREDSVMERFVLALRGERIKL